MRIYFTSQDLARTYLADDPDPLWELVNSLQALQGRYDQAVLGGWRRRVSTDLRQANLGNLVRAHLIPVAPHASYYPDLLTPPEAALGLEHGIEAVLGAPRHRLAAEIGRLHGTPGAGAWLADLRSGRAGSLTALGTELRDYHRLAVAPYRDCLRIRVHRDLAMRRQILRDGGVERLLDSFRPLLRWRRPVLEFTRHPSSREVHLQGRGIRLVPCYFARLNPGTIFDAELPQVVVYPIAHDPMTAAQPLDPALARLLGERRAAVLRSVADGCTTTEIARRVDISLASASRHAAVLRDAGLISSIRSGGAVLHTVTALGAALIPVRSRGSRSTGGI